MSQPTMSASTTTDDVLTALGEVIDPDFGINVVGLGFVYHVELDDEHIATPTFTPPWTLARITGDGREQLRAIGSSL